MAHFAHYVRREVIEVHYASKRDPWFAENQPDDQGLEVPAYHVTESTVGPATRIGRGDIIWIFSQLRSPWGVCAPALDAKICVSDVRRVRRKGKFAIRFAADPVKSSWFPLFDASGVLPHLTTVNSRGNDNKLLSQPHQPIGRALQSIRQLVNATPMLKLEKKLKASKFDFVSYRLIDGTRAAFFKSVALVQSGRPVFWDRWSLPRRLAERREFLKNVALDSFIEERIKASATVWAIDTPKYAEPGSYSSIEMKMAIKHEKLKRCPAGEI
jgi:hypothetical protein